MAKHPSGHGHKRPQPHPVTKQDLEELFLALWWEQRKQTRKIMAKLSTLAGQLGAITTKLDGVGDTLTKSETEITQAVAVLQKTIEDLQKQVGDGADPEIPADAQAALDKLTEVGDRLSTTAEELDNLNPDVETPPVDGGDTGTTPPIEPPSPSNPASENTFRPKSKLKK